MTNASLIDIVLECDQYIIKLMMLKSILHNQFLNDNVFIIYSSLSMENVPLVDIFLECDE
jgi:hypothetical protein